MSATTARSVAGPAGPTRAAVRELVRPRTAVDRLRARSTSAAAAGMGVALLAAASVAGLRDVVPRGVLVVAQDDGVQTTTTVKEPLGDLAPYLAEAGLRPGAVLAAVLLVLPFAALALQALRVGSLAARQQESLLVLAGAAPADLRRLRVAATTRAFTRGGLWAAPGYAVLWLLLGALPPPGARLLPVPQVWLVAAWVAVVGVLAAVGAAAGAVHGLSHRSGAGGRPPRARWAWGAGAGAVAVPAASWRSDGVGRELVPVLLLVALLLVLVSAAVALARRASRAPRPGRPGHLRRLGRRPDPAVWLLAAAQSRANPTAAGTAGGVLLLSGACVGVVAALSSLLVADRSYAFSDLLFYVGGAAAAAGVAASAAVVALLALALALSEHLLQARRSVAATAALGTEPTRLVAVQGQALASTAVPATTTGVLAGGIVYATLVGASSLADGGALVAVALALFVVAAASLAAAATATVACHLLARMLVRRVRAAASLENLRTP